MGMVGVPAACVGCHRIAALSASCPDCHLRFCASCKAKFGGACPNCGSRLV